MSRLVTINLTLKDGRSIMVSVDEDKVDRFSNGPDKLLDALAKKYPHELPTKPVYISVQDHSSGLLGEGDKQEITSEEITIKERRGQPGSFYWERNDVLTLIRLRSEKEPIFNKFGIRKKDVWQMIAEEFQSKGLDVTSGQCEQKWKNITKSYRDTVDYSYFSNTHRECPFFKELAAIYPYDPKEKHAAQQSGLNMTGMSGGVSGLGTKNTMTSTIVSSSHEFPNYPSMDTASSFSARPVENLALDIQQDAYLQEVTPDISVESLFQPPEIKQEIIDDDDDDDPVIVIPTSPQPQPESRVLTPPFPAVPVQIQTLPTTSVVASLSSNRATSHFQTHPLPQLTYASSITSHSDIPSSSSIFLPSLAPSSSPSSSLSQSTVKQESISLPLSRQYSSPVSNICLQPQMSSQSQQIGNSSSQTFVNSAHSQPLYSSSDPPHHQTTTVSSRPPSRKRPLEKLGFTSSSSSNSVTDMLAYRRRLLRKTPFSMPNSVVDTLKQMNEERRREHRTLLNTLNQHHEDILDLFKQHQQEYLHQEEIKQALLSELIERLAKH